MKNVRKAILVAAMALVGSISAMAQNQEALTFTRIERNPRAAALAGAGAASVSSAAYASFTNSAIIPFYKENADFALGYQYLYPDFNASHAINAAGAFKLGPMGIALGVLYQTEKEPIAGYNPSDIQVNLGFGAQLFSWLGVGLNARYIRENNTQEHFYNAFGVDAMVLFVPVEGLTLSAGVANIGSSIADAAGNKYPQPSSLRLAAAYNFSFAQDHRVELMLDEDYFYNSQKNALSVGAEYAFKEMLFARVGYRYATEGTAFPTHLGVGLGVQFFGFRLDVSYLTASDIIGNTLSLGLGYRF
jgi:opacity protein-like surface antigen